MARILYDQIESLILKHNIKTNILVLYHVYEYMSILYHSLKE